MIARKPACISLGFRLLVISVPSSFHPLVEDRDRNRFTLNVIFPAVAISLAGFDGDDRHVEGDDPRILTEIGAPTESATGHGGLAGAQKSVTWQEVRSSENYASDGPACPWGNQLIKGNGVYTLALGQILIASELRRSEIRRVIVNGKTLLCR